MRRPRVEMAGGIHHVYNRGNDGLHVFRDDDDRRAFIAHLALLSSSLRWSLLSYCVLGTHFHALLRTAEPNLGVGMRDLMGRTATASHARHGTRGRVWEDRFKSKLVLDQPYFQHLFRYIALNPVHAGLCSHPSGWARSAHRTLDTGRADGVVDLEAVAGLLGDGVYGELLDQDGPHGPWTTAKHPDRPRPPLETMLVRGASTAAIRDARFVHRYTVAEIARATGMSASAVSRRTCRG